MAYRDSKAFGADKKEEDGAYHGDGDSYDEESEHFGDDQAEEVDAVAGPA